VDEDERARSEVVVAYGGRVLLLELADRGEAAGVNAIMDGGKVSRAFLELVSACGNEVLHRKWVGEVRYEEGCLCDVKWKGGLHAVCHIKGGKASRLANHGMVSPEGEGRNCRPMRGVAVACLEDGVAHRTVLPLNNTICLGVIRRDVDVVYAIPVREPIECCDVSRAIVSDYLANCSPSAEDLLENKGANCASSLCAKCMPLGPGCE